MNDLRLEIVFIKETEDFKIVVGTSSDGNNIDNEIADLTNDFLHALSKIKKTIVCEYVQEGVKLFEIDVNEIDTWEHLKLMM